MVLYDSRLRKGRRKTHEGLKQASETVAEISEILVAGSLDIELLSLGYDTDRVAEIGKSQGLGLGLGTGTEKVQGLGSESCTGIGKMLESESRTGIERMLESVRCTELENRTRLLVEIER